MKRRRINLTRYYHYPISVRNHRVFQYWKRKILKKCKNFEFD
jgi:hypothetical protein